MRETYRRSVDAISDQLVEMTRMAGSAMVRASTALMDADLALAESVIAADDHLDQVQRNLEERAFDLLARQQPVATDLRIIVTSLRMSADLERMGDLARHVAKVARLRYPESAVPPELRSTLLEMAHIAERIVAKAGSVIASKDVVQALELERDDDWLGGVEQAIDVTLIGRY
jgi:phosphate transport system protein